MRYQVQEVSTEDETGLTYVLVHFWDTLTAAQRGDPPVLVNDFLMQLQDQGTRIVTNEDGWFKRLSDGVFIDPETLEADDQTEWEREAYRVDAPAVVQANIEAYIVRAAARNYSGDHTGDATKPFRIDGVVQPQRESQTFTRRTAEGAAARADVQAVNAGVIHGRDRVVRPIQGGSR